ncbi:MAG: hypothetical protein M3X11_20335 [Acidobacteriota bacterium]|nr:hypothetical protein [Acidobacteriota bacterium]
MKAKEAKEEATERLEIAVTGTMAAQKIEAGGEVGEKGTAMVAEAGAVRKLIANWPPMSLKAAEQTLDKYGPPNEALASRLIWYNNAPWKRTICYRDEVLHNFPAPHTDVIEQFIDYQVPVEKFAELAAFDGSVIVERTKGEVSARCDMEAANILALNLMHDIVTGKHTAEKAREIYSEVTGAYVLNQPAPYAEKLQFTVPSGDTADADKTPRPGPMMSKMTDKVKGIIAGEKG